MLPKIQTRLFKRLKRAAFLVAVLAVGLLGVRVYVVQSGPPLEAWHTFVPDELSGDEIDVADWDAYLQAEDAAFESLRTEVTQTLEPEERAPYNRYFEGSPIFRAHLSQDWNQYDLAEPDGEPAGAAVLLHGLTDSPYSLRHIGRELDHAGARADVPIGAGLHRQHPGDHLRALSASTRKRQRVGPV